METTERTDHLIACARALALRTSKFLRIFIPTQKDFIFYIQNFIFCVENNVFVLEILIDIFSCEKTAALHHQHRGYMV